MCGTPISAVEGPRPPQARWVRACDLDAVATGTIHPVRVAGVHLLLIREGDAVRAVARACPHEGADLALGRCAAGRLLCPRHLAWFDLRSGAVSPGWSFPPLRVYATRVVDDAVYVALP